MDAVFVRMGAQDAIMAGQSTFFVELAETAAMLVHATPRSLIVLDELGRGTATLDGAAIAAATLEQLAHNTGCCGMFATHYHQLAEQHAADPQVAIMHMGCDVSSNGAEGGEEVTFLYKLTEGACPRSYGTNVARLAGLPHNVISRAAAISARRTLCTSECAILRAQQLCEVSRGGSKSDADRVALMRHLQSSLVQ
jgi:DNA mismatch repair protein MSH6